MILLSLFLAFCNLLPHPTLLILDREKRYLFLGKLREIHTQALQTILNIFCNNPLPILPLQSANRRFKDLSQGRVALSQKLLSLALPKGCGKTENRPAKPADRLHSRCGRKLPAQAKNTWDFTSKGEYLSDFRGAGWCPAKCAS